MTPETTYSQDDIESFCYMILFIGFSTLILKH